MLYSSKYLASPWFGCKYKLPVPFILVTPNEPVISVSPLICVLFGPYPINTSPSPPSSLRCSVPLFNDEKYKAPDTFVVELKALSLNVIAPFVLIAPETIKSLFDIVFVSPITKFSFVHPLTDNASDCVESL